MFVQKHIVHGNFAMYFFSQYPFKIGWHFLLLLRVNAVYCAKSNTCLAFCRFRSRHRRAKYRLTIFIFCSLNTKEIKVISCRLCLIRCYMWDARSTLYDLLFIMKIPWSSPSFFLQSPGYPCSFVLYLSWPWVARCDSSFCGWLECVCSQAGHREGVGVKLSISSRNLAGFILYLLLDIW